MHLQTVYLSIFSLIILLIIFFKTYYNREKVFSNYKLFISMLVLNMVLLVIDLLSWAFNQQPGLYQYWLNSAFNMALYIIEPLVGILWVVYIKVQIFKNDAQNRKLNIFLVLYFLLNAIISVASLRTGWFFFVEDVNNVYQRGSYYWVHIALCYSLIIYAWFVTVRKRNVIDKEYYIALLVFPIPQIIGGLLQAMFYGLSLSWSGMTLSMLIVYLNIQDKRLNSDYLTGVYNRRQLDYYLQLKIKNSAKKPFSAILIDLDDFKHINNNFGHVAGDQALRAAVSIIRQSLRDNDFMARYGGDEFLIILDINSMDKLKLVADRIRDGFNNFNNNHSYQFKLNCSMGYDLYDSGLGLDSDAFIRHIDALMYNGKEYSAIQAIRNGV